MNNSLYFLLLIIEIILIDTKTATPDNLNSIISQSSPGDIIELQSGTYNKIPYKISISGTQNNPITIKPQSKATVKFIGSKEACIFELNQISNINIEGPMELSNSKCGIKVINSNNIKIIGLNIHDVDQEAIVVSGDNIEISNNIISNCVLESKNLRKDLTYGIYQCTSTLAKTQNNEFSKNIIFYNNSIENGYGEGIKLSYCDNCSIISNNITNSLAMNMYIYSSKNLLIKGNILKVINQDYNSKFGKAVGIGLSTDSSYDIEEVEIQNNIIIGCRIGIYYFVTGIGSYKSVKIYHNTIWMIDITPIWFTEPINPSSKSELFNNFIYHKKQYQLSPRSVWDIGYNMYYNTEKIPSQFDDTESNKGSSQAIKQMNLSEIFNNNNGDCDYSNANIKINCFRPNPNNKGNGNIYHKGKRIKDEEKDLEGCKRDTNPSIGAFEFPDGCQKDPEPPETDTDVPDTDIPEVVYDVKFKIDYRTDGSMKLVGSLCDWKAEGCYKMRLEGNTIWTYTLNSATKNTFKYKFLEYKGSNNYRWETNNRNFNGEKLAELAEKYSSGTYENCKYEKKEKVITYTCYWQ